MGNDRINTNRVDHNTSFLFAIEIVSEAFLPPLGRFLRSDRNCQPMNAENRPCGQKKERAVVCDTARSSFFDFSDFSIDSIVSFVYNASNDVSGGFCL